MPTYETTKFLSLPQQVNKNKNDIKELQDNQADISNLIPNTEKGQPLGVATLDASGKVPSAQLPSNPGNYLEKTGGTMEGSINMDGYDITVVGAVETGTILTDSIDSINSEIQVNVPFEMNNNKITGAAKGTANGDVATVENIQDHNTSPFAHADIRNLISAIQGAYIYRGVINENTVDVTQLSLTNRLTALMSRAPILGDVLTDLDRTDWYFDGTSWDNMGQTFVVLASAVNDGLMSKEDYTKLYDLYTKAQLDAMFNAKEALANKATDFAVLNDTKYPTTKAVVDRTFDKKLLTFTLPNRVTDYIKFENGKYYYVQRVQRYVLQASDVVFLVSSPTNVDYIQFNGSILTGGNYNTLSVDDERTTHIDGWNEITGYINWDDVQYVGRYSVLISGVRFTLIVAKGTYASLAEAQADLAGTVIYYQLATPIETEIDDIKTANWLYNLVNLEAWLTPTLTGATSTYIRYRKDTLGTVIVEGNITVGTSGTNFTMPTGYRPLFAYTVGILTFNTDGTVVSSATGTQSLSIRFTGGE